jgi:hypothetical protein
VIVVARELLAQGWSVSGVGEALGLPSVTVSRWTSSEPSSAFRPVAIVSEEATRAVSVCLVSPAGYRIEGLALADALRALATLG